jgi:hypothetical protein
MFGDMDEDGKMTFCYEEFPLMGFFGEEVWLSPLYSHHWTAEDPIVISIQ